MQKLGREAGKRGTKTRFKKIIFRIAHFLLKKKKKKKEEEEEESKKERKKRTEKKRKEKSIALFLTKVRETKPFFCGLRFLASTISLEGDHKLEIYTSP